MTILATGLQLSMIGHKTVKEPMTGWRAIFNKWLYETTCFMIITNSGFKLHRHDVENLDYSEYLGKDYLKT